jgi:pantoate--beta-alanine ligase
MTSILHMCLFSKGCSKAKIVSSKVQIAMPTTNDLPVFHTVSALRKQVAAWRQAGEKIALVPTMGALHAGHMSLVKAARKKRARVVTSIFVNPTQFAPTEDFSKYPRTFEADCALLKDASCDAVFAPTPDQIYPPGFCSIVTLTGPAKADLEDHFRPTHFDGVATVVAKLFLQCQPDFAFFGEKDYQQLQVVKQMARDLDLNVMVIGSPTIREKDGLAMSSRNRYLSTDERQKAALIPEVLRDAIASMHAGVSIEKAESDAKVKLSAAGYNVDYIAVRHAATLGKASSLTDGPLRILVAAKIGKTRLIDNMAV